MHDLEIRGAGEILGDQQSGEIHEIGFSLYLKMLNRAVALLRNNEILNVEDDNNEENDINIHAPCILTNQYCSDPNERLVIYKRLSSCKTINTKSPSSRQVSCVSQDRQLRWVLSEYVSGAAFANDPE